MENYIVSTDVGEAENLLDDAGKVMFEYKGASVYSGFVAEIQKNASL